MWLIPWFSNIFHTPPPYSTTVYKVINEAVQLFTELERQTKKSDLPCIHKIDFQWHWAGTMNLLECSSNFLCKISVQLKSPVSIVLLTFKNGNWCQQNPKQVSKFYYLLQGREGNSSRNSPRWASQDWPRWCLLEFPKLTCNKGFIPFMRWVRD